VAAVVAGTGTLAAVTAASATAVTPQGHGGAIRHVPLISVDGLHQQDLTAIRCRCDMDTGRPLSM
jgi:hypothetical protein